MVAVGIKKYRLGELKHQLSVQAEVLRHDPLKYHTSKAERQPGLKLPQPFSLA